MKHRPIALQNALVVNQKNIPVFGFTVAEERFVQDFYFHFRLREFCSVHIKEEY